MALKQTMYTVVVVPAVMYLLGFKFMIILAKFSFFKEI
jgi:hypothetical protein